MTYAAAETLYAGAEEYLSYLGVEELDEAPATLTIAQSAELLDASRAWDLLCGAPAGFFVANPDAWAKPFNVDDELELWVGALATDAGVVVKIDFDGDRTFEATLDPDLDYFLEPSSGPPFRRIVIDEINGRYRFPEGRRRVEVTGSWGWSLDSPAPVRRATLLIAKRYSVRPNTPEGVVGATGASQHMMRLAAQDPDVMAIVAAGGFSQVAPLAGMVMVP